MRIGHALAHYFHVFFFCSVKVVFFYTSEINPFPIFLIWIKFMCFVVHCY